MVRERLELIDFLRGIAIIDMMLVHYQKWFDVLPGFRVSKLIGYTDSAFEGFTVLAGFMVGYHYFTKFRDNRQMVVKTLLGRAFRILQIHYLMILTISLPMAMLLGEIICRDETTFGYIAKSVLLINQVGLLHILPTFIPLFLLAIPVLYLLEKKMDYFILLTSIGIFTLGNYYPDLFTIGDPRIFPVILWQIYFVLGILAGKLAKQSHNENRVWIPKHLVLGSIIFCGMCLIYFGHHFYSPFLQVKMEYGIAVSKFPLNYLGLLYHGSMIYVVCGLIAVSWERLQEKRRLLESVSMFGRHSLLSFVIHVYFANLLLLVTSLGYSRFPLPQLIIMANVAFTFGVIKYMERRKIRIGVLARADCTGRPGVS